MFFLFLFFLFLIVNLGPAYSQLQVYDLVNNNIKVQVLDRHRIKIINNGKIFRNGPIHVPPGEYMYIKYSFDFEGVQSSNTFVSRFITIGTRVLGILFIAYQFYDIMNNYLMKFSNYNTMYEAFIDHNPGLGQGSFLAMRDPFIPYKWRLACQGKTVYFNYIEAKNKKVNVFDDQEFYSMWPTTYGVVGYRWALYLLSTFTGEYMNNLAVQSFATGYHYHFFIISGEVRDYFSGGQAYITFRVGIMDNEVLAQAQQEESYNFARYIEDLKGLANPKAIKEGVTLAGANGVEVRGYIFHGIIDVATGDVLPEGFLIPVGQNPVFEQDVELVSESENQITINVEPPPVPEQPVEEEKDNWLIRLEQLAIRFPFSIPYTYSYLVSLAAVYRFSNYELANDIEQKIEDVFRAAGYNINLNLSFLAYFFAFVRTLGTILIIFLLVVGYRRLLL